MKNFAIPSALLTLACAAQAQTSLTLYGTADMALTVSRQAGQRVVGLTSGTNYESKFGFRGTEDLGQGLRLNFVLENGFRLDTGIQGEPGLAFGREAWVGLAGSFGELQAGRAVAAYDHVNGAGFSARNGNLTAANNVVISRRFTDYVNNGLTYVTPSFAGLTGAVTYGYGENRTPTEGAGRIVSASVRYSRGPLFLGVGHQTEKPTGNALETRFTRVTGTYDLRVARLLAAYGRVAYGGASNNEWHLGADVPVTPLLTLSGGIARSTGPISSTPGNGVYGRTAVVTPGEQERRGYGLAAYYALSRRTTLYAGYQSQVTKAVARSDVRNSLLAAGVLHLF